MSGNELSEILGISSRDAATLAGETASFQQGQAPQRQQQPNERPQGFQAPQQPQPNEHRQDNSFPTFRDPGQNTLGLSDRNYDPATDPRFSSYEQPRAPQHGEGERQHAPQQPGQGQGQEQQRQEGQGQQPPMMVPNSRVTEEAERRRSAEERMRVMEDRFALLQQTIQESQRQQLEARQRTEAPNPQEDLEGYVRYQVEAAQRENQSLRRDLDEVRQERQLREAIDSVNARAVADRSAFEQQAPDFQQAYNWYRNQQMAELSALGVSPVQATKHLDTLELQLSHAAQSRGMNSAEAFYRAAVARGWRSPQGGMQQQAMPQMQHQQAPQQYQMPQMQQPMLDYNQQNQNVTPIAEHPSYQPQAAYQQPAMPAQSQQLQNMRQGMAQSRTLDQAPPGASLIPYDLRTYADMPEADFMQHYDQIVSSMRAQMA